MFLINVVDKIFLVYMIMLFVKVLSSWVPEFQGTRFMEFISFYTDPYLNLFRKIIPPLGMLDISPVVAFFCLGIIEQFIKYIIITLIK